MLSPHEKAWASLLEARGPIDTQHQLPDMYVRPPVTNQPQRSCQKTTVTSAVPGENSRRVTKLSAAKVVKAQDSEQIKQWLFQATKPWSGVLSRNESFIFKLPSTQHSSSYVEGVWCTFSEFYEAESFCLRLSDLWRQRQVSVLQWHLTELGHREGAK